MPIAKMQKVRIVGIKRQRRHVLDLLQELGVLQVEEMTAEIPPVDIEREVNYEATLSELEFAIAFLEDYKISKKGFFENLTAAREVISYADIKNRVKDADFQGIIRECRRLESELGNLEDLTKNLLREKVVLEPWADLNFTLSEITGSEYVLSVGGTIPTQKIEKTKEAFAPLSADIQVIKAQKNEILVLISMTKDVEETVNKILSDNDFAKINMPIGNRTPAEELSKIQFSLIEADVRRDSIKETAKKLAEKRLDLMLVHDYFLQKKTAQSAEKKAGVTEYTFMVEGWVKKKEIERTRKHLNSFYSEIIIAPIKPEENETPPIAIENSPLVKPFEAVTGIYGLPSYGEVDPTPLLAVFFILYFGLCLGDAGYGLTLSIVAYFFYKKIGRASGAKRLLKLLVYAGIVTTIAGAMTGGWFGVAPAEFPAFLAPLQKFLISIRVIDPIQNPIGFLILALAFGVFQILFGIGISMYMKIRDGDYVDAVLDHGLWIYFLVALVALIVQKAAKIEISSYLAWFVLAGAAALVLTQGRKEKNPLLKIGKGVLSLYNTVGYLSDVLSYSRILALGMATSIIAMVINMVAVMTKGMMPVVGPVLMILVLIGGHIFNIAVNVLGAFIHSSRLQFVEFFSKFLEGGGNEFQPLKRETKFVDIRE